MFLASPAKQFLTTSACLPACRPAGHWNFQWSSSVVWFHFVASSMNTPFNNSYVARERGWIYQGQFYLHPAWCHHSSPQASRSRMITVSPFPSVLNPGNQVTSRRDYCYPQKVSAVRLGGIYQLDISQCMTKCKLWRTQSQQQHVEWCFSTLLCLIKLSASYYLKLRIAMTFYGECISISNPNNVIKQFVCTPNNVV